MPWQVRRLASAARRTLVADKGGCRALPGRPAGGQHAQALVVRNALKQTHGLAPPGEGQEEEGITGLAMVGRKAVEQREALGDALVRLGEEYPNLIVLSPDVSLSTRAIKFKAVFPNRFVGTGISEQNTLGMAAGLSTTGWLPVVVGYAMFVGGKAWEQVRNSVAYPHLNVKIVATHAGINVGADGVTHQAAEDIALMRPIPGMVILAPTDANQVACLAKLRLSDLQVLVRNVDPFLKQIQLQIVEDFPPLSAYHLVLWLGRFPFTLRPGRTGRKLLVGGWRRNRRLRVLGPGGAGTEAEKSGQKQCGQGYIG
jgi:hypothetical protein